MNNGFSVLTNEEMMTVDGGAAGFLATLAGVAAGAGKAVAAVAIVGGTTAVVGLAVVGSVILIDAAAEAIFN